MQHDWKLSAYRFDLPDSLIAQEPSPERGESRLMVVDRVSGEIHLDRFSSLADYLPLSVFVANDSKVIPARLSGRRKTGGKAEFLLLTPPPIFRPGHMDGGWQRQEVEGLVRPAKSLHPGDTVRMGDDFLVTILDKLDFGRCRAALSWRGDFNTLLSRYGSLPLPPYIRRPAGEADSARYQTVYADAAKAGSVAAPTAGLHFTEEMRIRLAEYGHEWQNVTLYVGYGTFSPVRCEDIRQHPMHSECIEISAETAFSLAAARQQGKKIVAVGTTAARVLEGAHAAIGRLGAYSGETDIFLYPGKAVRVVDHLLTNFHLPESTLLMLVSALAGRDLILRAYRLAVKERFRFFSYGDAMLIR